MKRTLVIRFTRQELRHFNGDCFMIGLQKKRKKKEFPRTVLSLPQNFFRDNDARRWLYHQENRHAQNVDRSFLRMWVRRLEIALQTPTHTAPHPTPSHHPSNTP